MIWYMIYYGEPASLSSFEVKQFSTLLNSTIKSIKNVFDRNVISTYLVVIGCSNRELDRVVSASCSSTYTTNLNSNEPVHVVGDLCVRWPLANIPVVVPIVRCIIHLDWLYCTEIGSGCVGVFPRRSHRLVVCNLSMFCDVYYQCYQSDCCCWYNIIDIEIHVHGDSIASIGTALLINVISKQNDYSFW